MNGVAWHAVRSLAFVLVLGGFASAGDWPQILGPDRNGIARDERLVDKFPASGPAVLWEHAVGAGFAGPAVMGDRVIVFHRLDDEDVVEALESNTGRGIWKKTFPAAYAGGFIEDKGPRCVPLIHEGRIYLFGAAGDLYCLSLADGSPLWTRSTSKDFEAPDGYFGFASSPIVEGGLLLVNVGGKRAGIVAFELASGKTAWRAADDAASYSSPVAATVDGVRHVIFVTRMNVVSLDPADGAVRFQFPFGKRGPTVNAATPVVLGDELFVTASYGVGAKLARIGKNRADVLWSSDDFMSSQYTTPILQEGLLYGIDDQRDVQDTGQARLICGDPRTQTVFWSEAGFGKASLMLADGKLLVLKTDGTLLLARPSRAKFDVPGTARLFKSAARPLPALSHGRLFARDQTVLKCIDLRKNP